MRSKLKHIVLIVGIPAVIIGFQNCSKVGTNGIAVDGQVLSLDGVEGGDFVQPSEPVATVGDSTPSQSTPGVPSQPEASAPVVSESPAPVVSESPAPVVSESPAPVVSESPAPVVSESPAPVVSESPAPVASEPAAHETVEVVPPSSEPAQAIEDTDVADAIRSCKNESNVEFVANLNLKFNHENVSIATESITSLAGNWGGSVMVKATGNNSVAGGIHVNHSTLVLCNFKEIKDIKGTFDKIIVVGGYVKSAQINNSTIALVNAKAGEVKGAHVVVKHYSLK